jgi:hypothetical protein
MAALAQGLQISQPVVGGIMVKMRSRVLRLNQLR